MTEVEALKKQLRERDEKDAQDKALASLTNSIEKGFQKLRSEEQLTTAGEESVRKLMEEKGITDPEIAWAKERKDCERNRREYEEMLRRREQK